MTTKVELHKVGMTPKQADDAMLGMKGATDTLLQLEALFKAIAKGCDDKVNDTKALANMGAHIASDIGNLTDCMIEQLENGEVK